MGRMRRLGSSGNCSSKTRWLVFAVASVGLWGCVTDADDADMGEDSVEELSITVEADKSRILQEEQKLQDARQTFQQEQDRLRRQRSEVSKKLATIDKKDRKQRSSLEAEQSRLSNEETKLRTRQKSFDSERAQLEADKTRLLQRISTMTQTKGGMTIAQREEGIARREKEVARREAKLAERERAVAKREGEVGKTLAYASAALEKLSSGGLTKTVVVSSSAAPSGNVSRSSTLRLQRQVKAKMNAEGILVGDLPPTGRELYNAAEGAFRAKDYSSAHGALVALRQVVTGIDVNAEFVKGKWARINKSYDSKKLDQNRHKKVVSLLNQASQSVTEGRYDRANRKLNQIVALTGGKK